MSEKLLWSVKNGIVDEVATELNAGVRHVFHTIDSYLLFIFLGTFSCKTSGWRMPNGLKGSQILGVTRAFLQLVERMVQTDLLYFFSLFFFNIFFFAFYYT